WGFGGFGARVLTMAPPYRGVLRRRQSSAERPRVGVRAQLGAPRPAPPRAPGRAAKTSKHHPLAALSLLRLARVLGALPRLDSSHASDPERSPIWMRRSPSPSR